MKKLYLLLGACSTFFVYAQTPNCITHISSTNHGTVSVFTSDGNVYTWGKNDWGQVGTGDTQQQNIPYFRPATPHFNAIAHAIAFTVAITTDGRLYTWGANERGFLGNGTIEPNFSPEQIGTDSNWEKINAGWTHVVALKNNGTIWGWGNNSGFEVSSQNPPPYPNNYYTQPVQVSTDDDWASVYAGAGRTFAIKEDGSLWAKGRDSNGSLGTGFTGTISQFTRIGTDNNWKTISSACYQDFTIGLKTDNTLWGWGDNQLGSVGTGTASVVMTPIQIGTDTWKEIDTGYSHSLGIKNDGTLWQWGYFGAGDNGEVLLPTAYTPVKVGNDNDWIQVEAGYFTSFALKADHTLWAWGYNAEGWYGNGTTTSSATPVLVFQCTASSVSEFEMSDIILYPNPTTDKIIWAQNITIEKATVFNLNGKRVLSPTIRQNYIDVSHLASGTYTITLTSKDGLTYHSRFIKK